jgi:hypothetical protein
MAAAEAERDAAETLVTEAWNNLFSVAPASSAELLALLRHVQRHVDEDHAPVDAIDLSAMVRAIGDAVQALRTRSPAEFEAWLGNMSPDRLLIDLAPVVLPLLNEADAEWAKVSALYRQAEEACGKLPAPLMSEAEFRACRSRFDVALDAIGYKAAWEAIQPLFERIEAMVGPLMDVPVHTLEGLILKQRIGQTLLHFEEDATKDLAKLTEAYRPGRTSPSAKASAPLPYDGLVDMLDLASASMDELQSVWNLAERVGSVAYAHAWGPRCQRRMHASGAPDFNPAGKLVQWVGDLLIGVESAAEKEAKRRAPTDPTDRETRLSMLAVTTIDNGDFDETEAFTRELLAHVEAIREGR